MSALRWTLSLIVVAGMIALSVVWRDQGGLGGLIGGAIGFVLRYLEPGQRGSGERVGNGYAGVITGLPIGFILGIVAVYGGAHWRDVLAGRLF